LNSEAICSAARPSFELGSSLCLLTVVHVNWVDAV